MCGRCRDRDRSHGLVQEILWEPERHEPLGREGSHRHCRYKTTAVRHHRASVRSGRQKKAFSFHNGSSFLVEKEPLDENIPINLFFLTVLKWSFTCKWLWDRRRVNHLLWNEFLKSKYIFLTNHFFLAEVSHCKSLSVCFPVQAAQEAVQQVADSSKETANTGKVHTPLSLDLVFYNDTDWIYYSEQTSGQGMKKLCSQMKCLLVDGR